MRRSSVAIERKGDLLILALRGQFDTGSLPELETKTKHLVERGRESMVFDVTGADFVGLSVISFILGCAGSLVQHGKKVKICGVPEWLRQVLDKSDISQYVKFYDDQFGALLSFGFRRWNELGVYERRSGIDGRERTSPFKESEQRKEKRRDSRPPRDRQELKGRRQSEVRW